MALEEREQADLLAGYCDALARGGAAAAPPGLDPELAATARRLVGGLRPPEPDGAFAARLRQQITTGARRPGEAAGARRLRRLPWALGGLAAAAALILLVLRLPTAPGTPVPIAAATAAAAPTEAPGAAPVPSWMLAKPVIAADQGVTLACLRALVHEPRFIDLFIAVGGATEPGAAPPLPADLQVLDQTGHRLPAVVTWLESAGGATVGAVTLGAVDPNVAYLELRVTAMQAGEEPILHGAWTLRPLQRFQPGAPIRPDSLEEFESLACFQAAGVAIGDCYSGCGGMAATGPEAPALPPSAATAAPLEGGPATMAPLPTSTAAPLPPTEAPAATAPPVPGPAATATPFVGCEFTDWEHGLFGLTLTVSAPQPHRLYIFISRENGGVRRVSEEEFERARRAAR